MKTQEQAQQKIEEIKDLIRAAGFDAFTFQAGYVIKDVPGDFKMVMGSMTEGHKKLVGKLLQIIFKADREFLMTVLDAALASAKSSSTEVKCNCGKCQAMRKDHDTNEANAASHYIDELLAKILGEK